MFVNRTTELAALDRWWCDGERPGLVRGRRRVGKTSLLQRLAADHRTVWHTGAGRPASGELGEDVVAIGPWWSDASDAEVDAVVVAARERLTHLLPDVRGLTAHDL